MPLLSHTITTRWNRFPCSTIHPDWFLFLASCWRLCSQIIKKHSACTNNFKNHFKWVQVFPFLIIFFIGSTIFTLALTRPHLFRSSEVYSVLTQTFSSFAPHLPCPYMLQWALQRKQTAEPWCQVRPRPVLTIWSASCCHVSDSISQSIASLLSSDLCLLINKSSVTSSCSRTRPIQSMGADFLSRMNLCWFILNCFCCELNH